MICTHCGADINTVGFIDIGEVYTYQDMMRHPETGEWQAVSEYRYGDRPDWIIYRCKDCGENLTDDQCLALATEMGA